MSKAEDAEIKAFAKPMSKAEDAEIKDLENEAPLPKIEELPLLFGLIPIEPPRLLRWLLGSYAIYFALHRFADLLYLFTTDGRFPPGMDYRYPSEWERHQTVSYTEQSITISLLQHTAKFMAVIAVFYFEIPSRLDGAMRGVCASLATIPATYVPSLEPCCTKCSGSICSCLGKCVCCCCGCCGFQPRWGTAFRGACVLLIFGLLGGLLKAPFQIAKFDLDVRFGFINVLSVSPLEFRWQLVMQLQTTLLYGIPGLLLLMLILQCRFGWVLLWLGVVVPASVLLLNLDFVAPMMFKKAFPAADFAVGRGFPLVYSTPHLVSLNRIYFPPSKQNGTAVAGRFETDDKSIGAVELAPKDGRWTLRGAQGGPVYAETRAGPKLKSLRQGVWEVLGPDPVYEGEEPRIGIRDGAKLRNEVMVFAKAHNIDVGDIYMIDGSHADARANAFVLGAGRHRVIGLYDTLFLGSRDRGEPSSGPLFFGSFDPDILEGTISVHSLADLAQGVDATSAEDSPPQLLLKAPTKAMTDNEILAILAHELGHAEFQHVEKGLVLQFSMSLATFAAMGWMVQSPVLALALGMAQPAAHIGLLAHGLVVAPVLDGVFRWITNAVTRKNEYEADAFAAGISDDYAQGLQRGLAKLAVNSNQDPDEPWFYEALNRDHPTVANRWVAIEALRRQRKGK